MNNSKNEHHVYHFCTMSQNKDGSFIYSDGVIKTNVNLVDTDGYDKIKDELSSSMVPPRTRKEVTLLSLSRID